MQWEYPQYKGINQDCPECRALQATEWFPQCNCPPEKEGSHPVEDGLGNSQMGMQVDYC